jgi:hypothetical protein
MAAGRAVRATPSPPPARGSRATRPPLLTFSATAQQATLLGNELLQCYAVGVVEPLDDVAAPLSDTVGSPGGDPSCPRAGAAARASHEFAPPAGAARRLPPPIATPARTGHAIGMRCSPRCSSKRPSSERDRLAMTKRSARNRRSSKGSKGHWTRVCRCLRSAHCSWRDRIAQGRCRPCDSHPIGERRLLTVSTPSTIQSRWRALSKTPGNPWPSLALKACSPPLYAEIVNRTDTKCRV